MFFEYKGSYFRDGMLYKEFLIDDIVQHTTASAEEKIMFADRKTIDPADIYGQHTVEESPRETEESNTVKKSVPKIFFKGDQVKIISGILKNQEGVIEEADSIRQEVYVKVTYEDTEETLIQKESEIMKVFKIGTHVKVIAGNNVGETGRIVLLDEDGDNGGNAILMSDYGDKEIKVFVNYLIASGEVSKGLVTVEGFELYDLVSVYSISLY